MHTTYYYNFWGNGDYIGGLFLENDESAKKVAKMSFAISFENAHTKQVYKKCIGCGEWYKADILTDGLCPGCSYLERLKEFINHCENELDIHWEDKEPLYKEDFVLSFKDKTIKLPFGATEYNFLIDCLKSILEDYQ